VICHGKWQTPENGHIHENCPWKVLLNTTEIPFSAFYSWIKHLFHCWKENQGVICHAKWQTPKNGHVHENCPWKVLLNTMEERRLHPPVFFKTKNLQ
jgi:2-succinyl-5-enolpyruvyl-6-hydroxy-3-cyclohexene-1-carboxylate synthase